MHCLGLEENKKSISISQVRDMGRLIAARPNEASHRMVLIEDADRMNVQAQNALLKVLEEPPDNTFFVLTASRTAPLLPTILSRCRVFRFYPLSPCRIRDMLTARYDIPARTAHILSRTLEPDIDRALECAGIGTQGNVNWQELRSWIINDTLELIKTPPHQAARKGLDISQKLSRSPERISDAMAVIRTVLRDLCILRYDENQIVNLDFFDAFKDISQIYVYPTFLEWLEDFYDTEKRLDSNSGHRLALDRFFLKLSLSKG